MKEDIILTRDIHKLIRGHLCWEESLRLLAEIVTSDEWMNHLEIDMMLYDLSKNK